MSMYPIGCDECDACCNACGHEPGCPVGAALAGPCGDCGAAAHEACHPLCRTLN